MLGPFAKMYQLLSINEFWGKPTSEECNFELPRTTDLPYS